MYTKNHTAIPWEAAKNNVGYAYIMSTNSNPFRIATVYGENKPNNKEEKFANAEFITRACNSYYKMFQALGKIYESNDAEEIKCIAKSTLTEMGIL